MILIANGVKVFCGPSLLKGWIDDATYPAGWKKEIRNLADDEIVPSGHFGKTYRLSSGCRRYMDRNATVQSG